MSQRICTIEWKKPEEIKNFACYQSFLESEVPLLAVIKGQGLTDYPEVVIYNALVKNWIFSTKATAPKVVEIVCWAAMPMAWTVLKSMEIGD